MLQKANKLQTTQLRSNEPIPIQPICYNEPTCDDMF